MSLLYECISGIIQGGILEAVEGTSEGEEVAKLCVGKLRGMMIIEGDANCKPRYTECKVRLLIIPQ
jgi:AP-3 complex subunit delta-1